MLRSGCSVLHGVNPDLKKKKKGQYITVSTRDANVQAVRKHLEQSPQKSTQRLT